MVDGGKAIGGMAIILLGGVGPAWVASSRAATPPELASPRQDGACVLPRARMRVEHPALLQDLRDRAVRRGERVLHASDGRELPISLNETCLGCHGSASGFCDRCHGESGVSLSCWQCHAASPPRERAGAF